MNDRIYYPWQFDRARRRYRAAVSLHSHTLHSKESLGFVERFVAGIPPLRWAIRMKSPDLQAASGPRVRFDRVWWTPPLSPQVAWEVERRSVEELGLEALVSLTDHNDIAAPIHLQVLEESKDIPISVEWTVPYGKAVFHLGVHNLPASLAHSMMQAMADVTEKPGEEKLKATLDWIGSHPQTLVVFNHPCWDQQGIGSERQRHWRHALLENMQPYIHALELNGLRPRRENREASQLAKATGIPLISGGDRHARQPNAVLNLTNATSFGEFVEEVRKYRWSDILVLPHCMESFRLRVVQSLCEILREDPQHSLGWRLWSDRVFYQSEDGAVRSLSELWGASAPAVVKHFVNLVHLADSPQFRPLLRLAFADKEGLTP